MTDIIGEISAAASEQSDGIGQVNTSVVQLDQMTQQNAALVEESAAAAESLKDQANKLAQAVGTFKLDASQAAAVAPSVTRATPHEAAAQQVIARARAESHKPAAAKPAATPPKPTQAAPKSRPAAQRPIPAAPVQAPTPHDDEWETF